MNELRGHHLFCLLFIEGHGYDEGFIENLKKIVKDWQETPVKIIQGPDDVCKKCPGLKNNQCVYHGNETVKEDDERALNLLGIRTGDIVEKKSLKEKISRVIKTWEEQSCF